ncbi:hypothetical protein HWV62_25478 [Athelia sp. TMB]|nr:hypothetical protein HWV62_25478 [Athelia sp. TMB]
MPQSDTPHSFSLPWQMPVAFLIASLMILVVQGFFCIRVWKFSNKKWPLVIIIAGSALVQFATGLQSVIRTFRNTQLAHFLGGHRREFHFDPSSAAIGPHIVLCQLYANTLNAALNSRKHLRAIIDRSVEFSIAVDEPPEAACQIPNVVVV